MSLFPTKDDAEKTQKFGADLRFALLEAKVEQLTKALKTIRKIDARPDLSLHKFHQALDIIHELADKALENK